MDLLPTEEAQAGLLACLRQLVALRGAGPLLAGPIEPSDRFFPDAYVPSLDGARVVAERLLGYAGLDLLRCEVQLAETLDTLAASSGSTVGGTSRHTREGGAIAWFAGIREDTCLFGVAPRALHDPESLVAALAHEVAHVYRAVHGLVDASPLPEEPATDATAAYLGFGILGTNAADRVRTSGGMQGTMTVWSSDRLSLGYLPPQAFAFLLGVQAVCRDVNGGERRRVRSLLETNQAASFDAAVGALRRGRSRLLVDLGLEPSCRGAPAPEPKRLVAGPSPEGVVPDPSVRGWIDNRGRKTFRVTGRSHQARGLGFFAIGILAGVTLWLRTRVAWWLAAGIVSGVVLRKLLGGPLPDVCSEPERQAELAPGLTACPRCGGTIVGTLTDPNQRLDHPGTGEDAR